MDNARALHRADCDTHTYEILQSFHYLREASISSAGYEAMRYAAPDTNIYTQIDFACRFTPSESTQILNPYSAAKEYLALTPRH